MSEATLVFPFQLFDPHPALERGRKVVLIEESLVFGDPHVGLACHKQRIVLLRVAMRAYGSTLESRGHDVEYVGWREGKTIGDSLAELAGQGFDELHLCEVVDFLLMKRLERERRRLGLKLVWHDTPMFLTPGEVLAEHFQGRRKPFMARFYKAQRSRMGILVDSSRQPVGGHWSFDDENRKPMPKRGLEAPSLPRAAVSADVQRGIASVEACFPDYFGATEPFVYPVTHVAAARWLDEFLENRLDRFGPYEDAISGRERTLFHSVLTPMLNIGLLTPRQIVDRTLEFAAERDVPLNSLEGFVRQVIGWREFMRGAYDYLGVPMRNGNFWEFEDRPIPEAFYRGETGVEPVDVCIRRALETGYCHHIERLMILGNFMLLCGFHPKRVCDWFMELFVDAYDWVMVPNVHGMSQFGDGGLFTTKPYLSGSNYVLKMSDYRRGSWCEIWDGLFWSFIERHQAFFRSQHRLGMMARQLDRMDPEKLRAHRKNAEAFLEGLSW